MKYIYSFNNPHQHLVDIEFIATNINSDIITLQLPCWRPGRYEMGNFAKNIQRFEVFDANNKALLFKKITKDSWEVNTKGVKELHVKYNYYATDLNAGSTYLDEKQLYVNPVNCSVFIPGREHEKCEVVVVTPWEKHIACGMTRRVIKKNKNGLFEHDFLVKDYHELADSPFVASDTLQHNMFVMDGVEFHFWFQGECRIEWAKLINDFFIFINEQFVMMKQFPVNSYNFIFQITPYRFYHGVEHVTSTVIALGPGYAVMNGDVYEDLLGVSSHELFHVWNVKTIRPVEMLPYNYTKENYSRTGYVYEGVTTYYGDLILYRSGVFSDEQYFKTFNQRLQLHFDNFGRYNMSVADSSFDTWLDGYVQGIPNRKTSIYHEGSLISFMLDMIIRKNSSGTHSLDDIMRELYHDYAIKNKGYTAEDYKRSIEKFAGISLDSFFNDYINGANTYDDALASAMEYIGCELQFAPAPKFHESYYGFKITEGQPDKVSVVYPGSIADKAGLYVNDDILAINTIPIKNNLADWCKYFAGKEVSFTIVSNGYTKEVKVKSGSDVYFKKAFIAKSANANDLQKQAYMKWSGRKF